MRKPLRPEELFDVALELRTRAEKAEVEIERLRNGMQGSCYCCEPVGEMNQKLESEVERLKEQLKRAVEIAEKALKGACGEWGCIGKSDEEDKLLAELDQLKATLNQDNK